MIYHTYFLNCTLSENLKLEDLPLEDLAVQIKITIENN
jgi:hypothetical protein